MQKFIRFTTFLTILLILVGCATVSKEDCLVTDWFETGRMDGMYGKPRTAFHDRAKSCLVHGIKADRQAYYQGHDIGLKSYCTEPKGFELGRQGLAYQSICPLQIEEDFRTGYDNGIRLYCSQKNGYELGRQGRTFRNVCPPELEMNFRTGYIKGKEIYQHEVKINSLQRRLKKIERKINEKEKELYSAHLNDAQRSEIRLELKKLDVEYRDVSRQLKFLEKTIPIAQN